LAQHNRGIMKIVREELPEKTGEVEMKIRKSGSPKAETKLLRKLVSDPDSPAADLLAYLYNQIVNDGNVKEYRAIFEAKETVEEDHVEDAKVLVQMQEKYEELIGDQDNLEIGNRIVALKKKKGEAEKDVKKFNDEADKLVEAQKKAAEAAEIAALAAAAGKPVPKIPTVADPDVYLQRAGKAQERAEKFDDTVDELDLKRRQLAQHLVNFGNLAQTLRSPDKPTVSAWTITKCRAMAGKFSAGLLHDPSATGPDCASKKIKVGTQEHTVVEWLENPRLTEIRDNLQSAHETTKGRPKMPKKPPARYVLRQFLMKYLEPSFYGTTKEQQAQIISTITAGILGASDTETPAEEKKRQEKEAKKGRIGRAAGWLTNKEGWKKWNEKGFFR